MLTSIVIPDSVIGFGEGAFAGNPLTSITIPFATLAEADSAWSWYRPGWRNGIDDDVFVFARAKTE